MKKIKVLLISLLFFVVDLISKLLVVNLVSDKIKIIPDFLDFLVVKNTGGGLSILSGHTYLIVIISCLILFLFIFYMPKHLERKQVFVYSMLIGGILGNLFERILFGYVTDFIHFTLFNMSMPIFNIADIFICVSIFLIMIEIIRSDKNEISSR